MRICGQLKGILRESLPDEAAAEIAPTVSVTGEIMLVALTAKDGGASSLELRELAEYDLRTRLLGIPGIGEVAVIGGRLPECRVSVDPRRLAEHGLAVADVIEAARDTRTLLSAGYLANVGGDEFPLRQLARADSISALRRAAVPLSSGDMVRLGEVALVFLPLMMLSGLEGRFFRPLALSFLCVFTMSLVVSWTAVPALSRIVGMRDEGRGMRDEGRGMRMMKAAYRPFLDLALRFPKTVVTVAVLLATGAVGLALDFGSSFLPPFREDSFNVALSLPPGASLAESERIAEACVPELRSIPGVLSVTRRTGRAERDQHAEPVSSSEYVVRVDMNGDTDAVKAAIRERIGKIPGCSLLVGYPIAHRIDAVLSGTEAAIFLILVTALRSVRAAMLTIINVPLGLVGGVAAVAIADPVLSVPSLVGFITVSGFVIRNGLLLINRYQGRLAEDADLETAIRDGSLERMPPIIMTSLTTVFGLVPIILSGSKPGGELLAPLAIVQFGGLIGATALNLIVLPAAAKVFRLSRPAPRLVSPVSRPPLAAVFIAFILVGCQSYGPKPIDWNAEATQRAMGLKTVRAEKRRIASTVALNGQRLRASSRALLVRSESRGTLPRRRHLPRRHRRVNMI